MTLPILSAESAMSSATAKLLLSTAILGRYPAHAWNSNSNNNRFEGDSLYSQSGKTTWMYNSAGLSFEYLGCAWGYTEDNEDFACMEDSSEDGTTYWYKMANCRRAQVAFNVYWSDSSSSPSCDKKYFAESFHSTNGLAGWVALLNSYEQNSYITYDDVQDLGDCAQGDSGYYEMLGCSEKGTFQISTFEDSYCMTPIGYSDSLTTINQYLSNMGNCVNCYDSSNGGDVDDSTCGAMLYYSETCSTMDHAICGDPDGSKSASYSYSGQSSSIPNFVKMGGIGNKVKYVFGSLFLVSSFIMFLGILMMNRRKRRANLNRKFRQHASGRKRRSGDGKSRSRSRRGDGRRRSRSRGKSSSERERSGRSSSRRRSKSSSRKAREPEGDQMQVEQAVYT